MKNIEKYKEEIFEETKELSLGCAAAKLAGFYCPNRKCKECRKMAMDWLLEEYKEPVLTEKEKAYLKNVIEPKRNDVAYIKKNCYYRNTIREYNSVTVYLKNQHDDVDLWCLLDFVVTKDMPFESMELDKKYTIEELGL